MITKYNDFDNVAGDRSKYVIENNVICKYVEELKTLCELKIFRVIFILYKQ